MLRLFLALSMTFNIYAQDEWFFIDMMNGKVQEVEKKVGKVHYKNRSKAYQIDFTGDGVSEYLYLEYSDGKIMAHFKDQNFEPLYKFQFPLKGHSARVYRVLKKNISQDRIMVLFHYFAGASSYLGKAGSAFLYGGVVENGSFKDFELTKLGSIWLEEQYRDNYLRRLYEVGFKDIDNNGQKELIIKSGPTKRVIHYEGKGKWLGL